MSKNQKAKRSEETPEEKEVCLEKEKENEKAKGCKNTRGKGSPS